MNLIYALVVAAGAALIAATVVRYLDAVTADFLAQLNAADFWPGIGEEADGRLGRMLGYALSWLIWGVSMVVWGLVGLMRGVAWVLNLNLGQLSDVPNAGIAGLGAALAALAVFAAARNRTAGIGIFGGLVALGAYAALAHGPVVGWLSATLPLGLPSVESDDFGGFLLAIVIGVTAISASLPLGILLALGRRSDMFLVKTLSVGFIEFIRACR